MVGYGYSAWLVPDERTLLQRRYGMRHVPHVTVRTNMASRRDADDLPLGGRYAVGQWSDFAPVFPRMYQEGKPLRGCGFYCAVSPDVRMDHRPHLTVAYGMPFEGVLSRRSPETFMRCTLMLADTRAADPAQWYVLALPFDERM